MPPPHKRNWGLTSALREHFEARMVVPVACYCKATVKGHSLALGDGAIKNIEQQLFTVGLVLAGSGRTARKYADCSQLVTLGAQKYTS